MAQELQAEELGHATDWHIMNVTLLDGQYQTINEAICMEFRQYCTKLFSRCEGRIMEDEVWQALKSIGLDKSPRIDGLPYKVYLRL